MFEFSRILINAHALVKIVLPVAKLFATDVTWSISLRRLFSISLFGLYIMSCLLIGEHHPFTTVPMYNYLPSESYVFYFNNKQGQFVPLNQFTSVDGAAVSHKFYNLNPKLIHFRENFCGSIDSTLCKRVYQDVVPPVHNVDSLTFCRSCINARFRFGDNIQVLYNP